MMSVPTAVASVDSTHPLSFSLPLHWPTVGPGAYLVRSVTSNGGVGEIRIDSNGGVHPWVASEWISFDGICQPIT